MIIAWFSCGATSAVACKIALSLYDDVHIYYIETGSGHPDNTRFLADCEKWYNNLSTLSEATSTPVCLMCCERGISTARMVPPVLLN